MPYKDDDFPVPVPLVNNLQMPNSQVFCDERNEVGAVFPLEKEDEPRNFSQGGLNYLVRDFALSKDNDESLASRLKKIF